MRNVLLAVAVVGGLVACANNAANKSAENPAGVTQTTNAEVELAAFGKGDGGHATEVNAAKGDGGHAVELSTLNNKGDGGHATDVNAAYNKGDGGHIQGGHGDAGK